MYYFFEFGTPIARLSECYADMRVKMANESDARIVLGGKQKNFAGYFPGIVEETFHSL